MTPDERAAAGKVAVGAPEPAHRLESVSVWLPPPSDGFPSLPPLAGFGSPEPFRETCTTLAEPVELVGWSCRYQEGPLVTGAAAGAFPDASVRAWGEFVERAGSMHGRVDESTTFEVFTLEHQPDGQLAWSEFVVTQPEASVRQRSVSVGIAAHTDWRLACRGALFELYERDALVRAWRGALRPERVATERTKSSLIRLSHELEVYRMGAARWSPALRQNIQAVAAVAWPRSPEAPFTLTSAASTDLDVAIAKAICEAEQGVAFLSGATWDDEELAPGPTPLYHQAYYQRPAHREALRPWLNGELTRALMLGEANANWHVRFVELTPPEWRGYLHIVKAMAPQAEALYFGQGLDPAAPPHPFA